jgi:hypothetical protein
MPAMPLPITTSLRFCMFIIFIGGTLEKWEGRNFFFRKKSSKKTFAPGGCGHGIATTPN